MKIAKCFCATNENQKSLRLRQGLVRMERCTNLKATRTRSPFSKFVQRKRGQKWRRLKLCMCASFKHRLVMYNLFCGLHQKLRWSSGPRCSRWSEAGLTLRCTSGRHMFPKMSTTAIPLEAPAPVYERCFRAILTPSNVADAPGCLAATALLDEESNT